MAVETQPQIDYEWLTYSRVRVLRELAAFRREREGAANIGIAYSSFRSIVEELKNFTGLRDIREIGHWWGAEAPRWLVWAAEQAGVGSCG